LPSAVWNRVDLFDGWLELSGDNLRSFNLRLPFDGRARSFFAIVRWLSLGDLLFFGRRNWAVPLSVVCFSGSWRGSGLDRTHLLRLVGVVLIKSSGCDLDV